MSVNSIFFHEDNYCQIELLPIENPLMKRSEADLTKDYSEKNLTEDGFISVTSISQTTYPINTLNITLKQFQIILNETCLFFYDKVYTGYSTQRIVKKNTHGFGFENYILFYEFDDNVVTKCWIDYNSPSDTLNGYPEKLQAALFKLGEIFDLILIDWNEVVIVRLKNKVELVKYIKEVL